MIVTFLHLIFLAFVLDDYYDLFDYYKHLHLANFLYIYLDLFHIFYVSLVLVHHSHLLYHNHKYRLIHYCFLELVYLNQINHETILIFSFYHLIALSDHLLLNHFLIVLYLLLLLIDHHRHHHLQLKHDHHVHKMHRV